MESYEAENPRVVHVLDMKDTGEKLSLELIGCLHVLCLIGFFFFFLELSVSVIVTSEVRKPQPDTRGILSQGPLFIIFLFFP